MVSREHVSGQRELNGNGPVCASLCTPSHTAFRLHQPGPVNCNSRRSVYECEALVGAQQEASTAMPKRLRWSVHVVLTVISFATAGRAPRLPVVGPRDQQAIEERLAIVIDE